jgi:uncharacterized protein involved in type VI secretion and phage assembly
MINGLVVGLVIDNVDPDRLGRVKVKYPVDAEQAPESTWVRIATPDAGKNRGLVMLPETGTEVVVGFAYRTLEPYVMGAVYNGEADKPVYANEDGKDDHRRVLSRSGHRVDFSDEAGKERVDVETKAKEVTLALDAAEKVFTGKAEKNVTIEAKERLSIKCRDFKLEASGSVTIKNATTLVAHGGTSMTVTASSSQTWTAGSVSINGGNPAAPTAAPATPAHRHPPTKA